MPRIQFGLSLPGGLRPGIASEAHMASLRGGLQLVSGHFDSAWFSDHLQQDASPLLEGWTALTYLAALQPELRFGHSVLCQSFRNPALLAKMAATLQYMSGGRYIFGIGAGWKEDEYLAYGYDFPSAGTRITELEETLQIVKALWSGKRTTIEGRHYQVANAYCLPKPDPIPPVVIGGTQPHMLHLIARHADWWNVSLNGVERYRGLVADCERACAEVGRDPATLRRTRCDYCFCVPTEADAEALEMMGITPARGLVGTPSQVIEQMRPFIELGVDYFMLGWGGFPDLTTPRMLVEEVLPALNR